MMMILSKGGLSPHFVGRGLGKKKEGEGAGLELLLKILSLKEQYVGLEE